MVVLEAFFSTTNGLEKLRSARTKARIKAYFKAWNVATESSFKWKFFFFNMSLSGLEIFPK